MDEVQSWWEVPAIAHFCYTFRDVFKLLYFEIGELEAAILNMQDPEMSMSLEQLIIKLLQGCFDDNEVRADNWEEKLIELFEDNCEDDDNPVKSSSFHFLSPRLKVEVLYKLCHFRLDTEEALELTKDMPAECMKASCIGKDGQNNLYWYFCDERLYKEDPSKKPKKIDQPVKNATNKNSTITKNGNRSTKRERKPVIKNEISSPWTIVCFNTSDWESLVKGFSKSKNANEKELVNQITNKYLPMLKDVVAEKNRLLWKRYTEFAPKRVSSRISKVQAQRKLEDQKAAEAAEAKRIQQEEERKRKEAEQEKLKKEARQKRAEEREKIIHARLLRAKQRELMKGYSTDSESEEEKPAPTISVVSGRPQRARRTRSQSTEQTEEKPAPSQLRVTTRPQRARRSRSQSSEQSEDKPAPSKPVVSARSQRARSSRSQSSEQSEDKPAPSKPVVSARSQRARRSRSQSTEQSEGKPALFQAKVTTHTQRAHRLRSQSTEQGEEKPIPSQPEVTIRPQRTRRSNEQDFNNVDLEKQPPIENSVHNNHVATRTSPRTMRRISEDKRNSENDHDYVRSPSKSSSSYVPEQRLLKASEDVGSYSLNRTVDSSKRKVATISYLTFPDTKRSRQNGITSFTVSPVKSTAATGSSISSYKENDWYSNSCKKVTSSPSIIRLSFIKPPAKSQS